MRRIPSLDGLRAVAITAVLLGHLTGTQGFPVWATALFNSPSLDVAHMGVRVFFVLSGFLITRLLLAEESWTGRISLTRFYRRRVYRIMPAYLVYVGVVAALDAWRIVTVPTSDFVTALTYTINYDPHRAWAVGHLWSLAVEEQFYLLWPAALILSRTRERAVRVVVGVLVLAPIVRVVMASTGHVLLIGTSFETTADALAMGCLLALCRDAWSAHPWYGRATESRWMTPTLFLAGLVVSLRYRPGLLLGEPMVNAAIMLLVDRCVRRPHGTVGRLLNWRPIVFVGTISYSLYLWQQLFLNRTRDGGLVFPVDVLAALACALLSYYLVERPMRRQRYDAAHGVVTV